ncbi:MAG TPA: ABC transporter ATP-binding protein [Acidimicrobiales bacterium]|nr:ABC transporter ATP-binding protein [Acidimicrobiales bacterium]
MSPARSAEPAQHGLGTPPGVPEPRPTPPAPAPSPAVYTAGLSKHFGSTVALRSLSITVERGEVFGFLGPNGAGKTTAVKVLLGLVRPTGGEGLVLGAPLGDRLARRRIGYLPELFRFQGLLSAAEVVRLHSKLLGLPKASWPAESSRVLRTVGLDRRADDRVATFSKGMQQRLGIAVALLGDPLLVVLDEPTSALDPVGRRDVREIIRALRAGGTTVFLNTHLLDEAEHICDRVAVIDRGSTVATGTLPELLGHHWSVRLKVTGLPDRWWAGADLPGSWSREEDWVRVRAIDPTLVPDVVARLVGRGGRVEAVVPENESLEARFLELLEGR